MKDSMARSTHLTMIGNCPTFTRSLPRSRHPVLAPGSHACHAIGGDRDNAPRTCDYQPARETIHDALAP